MSHEMCREKAWPGPKPYEETDWPHFFGRRDEVTDLRNMILGHRLSILAGGSGTGKTSLVRAGLISSLRLRRYHTGAVDRPWPVLVFRDWAEPDFTDPEVMRRLFLDAIDAIRRWADGCGNSFGMAQVTSDESANSARMAEMALEEYELLKRRIETASIKQPCLSSLAKALVDEVPDSPTAKPTETDGGEGCDTSVNGIIVVLDQFEELMRSGVRLEEAVTDQLRHLVQSALPVRVLISLREDFVTGLRDLESAVGKGLLKDTWFLEPMKRDKVMEVVKLASNVYGKDLSDAYIERLLTWVNPDLKGSSKLSSADLMKLQAVLHADHMMLDKGQIGDGTEFARALTGVMYGDFKRGLIVQKAIERWIEEALNDNAAKGEATQDSPLAGNDLTAAVKSIATRIAPHMSSGDFKVPQREAALFRKAMGDDILLLYNLRPSYKDKILFEKKILLVEGTVREASVECDKRTGKPPTMQSWKAREKGWSPEQTATQVGHCFKETLERLDKGNILKRMASGKSTPEGATWNLVHDQMGAAFNTWAELRANTFLDRTSSLVASSGITPLNFTRRCLGELCKPGSAISNLQWRGCRIQPMGDEDLCFHNVVFEKCDFSGCIFDRCVFQGCGFRNCILNGGLFLNCVFREDDDSRPPSIFFMERCKPKQLGILWSEIQGMSFRQCEITQLTIGSCDIGRVAFEEKTLVLQAYFEKLRKLRTRGEQGIFFEGENWEGGACHCTGDYKSWDMVEFSEKSLEDSCARAQQNFLFPDVTKAEPND